MSDPSQMHIPNSVALTSDLMYNLKPSAPRSRSYRLSVAPLNKSSFVGGDQIIIELPTGRKNTFLDQSQSYIKFSVQVVTPNTANSSVNLENTAYSFFQRLDVYNSSNLLETINEYGQLSNMLIDTSLTQSDKAGLSALIGSNNNLVSLPTALNTNSTIIQVPGDRSGLSLATTNNISTANLYTFSLPVLSGVIGVNASKMIPLGQLSAPIRTEWFLSQNDDAIYYGTAAGANTYWQISNVELEACYVEIYDDINIVHDGPQYISTTTYRNASTYLSNNTAGEFSVLVPFRCASLTGLYARFRNFVSAVQGVDGTAAYRKSSSINPNFNQVYFRIGSSIYPNKPIYVLQNGSASEAYAELLKSFHALSSSIGNSAITHEMYNVSATAVGPMSLYNIPVNQATSKGTYNNAFMIGLECQSFSNRNDTILSGISTLNSQIYFTGVVRSNLTCGGTNNLNYTIDFFSSMDMILVIENGVMSAKF